MRRPSVTLVIAVAALVVAAAGVARAAIPAGDGKIRGCYEADPAGSGGVLKDLYVVDDRDPCPAGTSELLWNQTGPPGTPGAPGPAGPPGAPGATEPKHGAYRTDVRFAQDTVEIRNLADVSATVECRTDETAIGGGADLLSIRIGGGYFALLSSIPTARQRAWTVTYVQVNPLGKIKPSFKPILVIRAWAVCARTLVTAVPPMPPSTGVTFGPRP